MRQDMKRWGLVLMLFVGSLGLIPAGSFAQGQSPLMPPQSNAFGKSFGQWNVLQTQWAIDLGLGDGTGLSNPVGRVRLLPGAFFTPTPTFNITLAPATPFVAAPFFLFGERYDDPSVPDDDPAALADLLALVFADAHIKIVLDGRTLLDGSGDALKPFFFGPTYFDDPIVYDNPQPRGDVNSVAALWVAGFGATYRPLPVGRHVLVYTVNSAYFGDLVYTYNLTVAPH
jgi:hypothetical protein